MHDVWSCCIAVLNQNAQQDNGGKEIEEWPIEEVV